MQFYSVSADIQAVTLKRAAAYIAVCRFHALPIKLGNLMYASMASQEKPFTIKEFSFSPSQSVFSKFHGLTSPSNTINARTAIFASGVSRYESE